MDKRTVLTAVAGFRRALEKEGVRPEKIIMYGSWADNTARPDSDIDLVVISSDFSGKDYWARIDILSRAIYEIFAPIEVSAFTPQEWASKDSFVWEYAKKGIQIN